MHAAASCQEWYYAAKDTHHDVPGKVRSKTVFSGNSTEFSHIWLFLGCLQKAVTSDLVLMSNMPWSAGCTASSCVCLAHCRSDTAFGMKPFGLPPLGWEVGQCPATSLAVGESCSYGHTETFFCSWCLREKQNVILRHWLISTKRGEETQSPTSVLAPVSAPLPRHFLLLKSPFWLADCQQRPRATPALAYCTPHWLYSGNLICIAVQTAPVLMWEHLTFTETSSYLTEEKLLFLRKRVSSSKTCKSDFWCPTGERPHCGRGMNKAAEGDGALGMQSLWKLGLLFLLSLWAWEDVCFPWRGNSYTVPRQQLQLPYTLGALFHWGLRPTPAWCCRW